MTFSIRRATADDIPIAARIIAEALAGYGLPFEPEGRDGDVKLFGTRGDHDDFVGSYDDWNAHGVASVGPHGDDGVAWLSKVFVAKEARGRGLGRALIQTAHDAARARGYRRVGLRTRVVFVEAIALYESLGYVPIATDATLLERGDVVYFLDLE